MNHSAFNRNCRIVNAILESTGVAASEPERCLSGGYCNIAGDRHAAGPRSSSGSGAIEYTFLMTGEELREAL